MTWSNLRFNVEGLLLPWQQIYHLAFCSIFRTTPEVSIKLYFVEIGQISEKLWLFNHKRADFWLPNFGFKRSLLSLLKSSSVIFYQAKKATVVWKQH